MKEYDMKQFFEHYSGMKVAKDGEVFVPRSGKKWKEHYTYGSASVIGHMRVTYQGVEYKIQTLVAEVFLNDNKPIPEGYDVHHINECKWDNRTENLVILTHSEHTALHKTGKSCAAKPVYGVNKTTGEEVRFSSATEAANVLGINKNNISACCRGVIKTSGGYYWYYI